MHLAELKPHLEVYGNDLRQKAIDGIAGAYTYLRAPRHARATARARGQVPLAVVKHKSVFIVGLG